MTAGAPVPGIPYGRARFAEPWASPRWPFDGAPVQPVPGPARAALQSSRDVAREMVRRIDGSGTVLVIVPDRTRPFPLDRILPDLFDALDGHGTAPDRVTIAIASGTHRPDASDLARSRFGSIPEATRIVAHDPRGPMADLGRTAAGTPVRIHPLVTEAQSILAIGGTAFHYFAGFGGGPKLLFPGLGESAAVAATHRLSLAPWPPGGLAPGVGPGRRIGNPVAEDLLAVGARLPRAVHATLWRENGVPGREEERHFAGEVWSDVAQFERLCADYAAPRWVRDALPSDLVLASAGGWPRDLDVVQAHKALFHASLFARPGAAIVFYAECEEGVGSAALARWLDLPDRNTLEERARSHYDLNAQTAISLASIAERFQVTWIGRPAHEGLVRMGFGFEENPERAVLEAARSVARDRGTGARVTCLTQAAELVPASP